MASPKTLWYVEVLPGGRPLRYREKGSSHYAREAYAREYFMRLRQSGVNVRLMKTITNWEVVEDYVEVE